MSPSNDELQSEMAALRQRLAELETVEADRDKVKSALQISERRYSSLFEEMHDALYISTIDGSFIDVNRAAVQVLGYQTKDELLAVDISRRFYARPAERNRVMEEIAKRGYAKNLEVQLRKKDGTIITALETCRERINAAGEVIGYEGIFRDITEQQRAERIQQATYRISEAVHTTHNFDELLRSIHHTINELMPAKNFFIALFDSDANSFDLPYFADEKGDKPAPQNLWRGLTGYVFRTGGPLLATADKVNQLIDQNKIERISTPSVCWLGVPLKSRTDIIGVLAVQSYTPGVTYDIHDQRMLAFVSDQVAMAIGRKRSEEELRASAVSFRELFNNANDAIYIQDEKGRFIDVNAGAVEMYGYPRDFFAGKTPEALAAPGKNDLDHVQELVAAAYAGTPQQFEFWGRRKNGEVFPKDVRLARSVFFGQPVVIAFARDISEQKRREQGIARLNDVLKLTNAIIRHDILNDLNVIRGSLELYEESCDHDLLNRAFGRIEQSIELIKRMRELEALVAASGDLKQYDVRPEVENAMTGFEISYRIKGDGTVLADDAFQSVIENIIRNAVIHGQTDRIEVDINNSADRCEIRIADFGTGIPTPVQSRVFDERFSYGDQKGTGLGLYIVQKTVERYGGQVTIEDNHPQGTVFVLHLNRQKKA